MMDSMLLLLIYTSLSHFTYNYSLTSFSDTGHYYLMLASFRGICLPVQLQIVILFHLCNIHLIGEADKINNCQPLVMCIYVL